MTADMDERTGGRYRGHAPSPFTILHINCPLSIYIVAYFCM